MKKDSVLRKIVLLTALLLAWTGVGLTGADSAGAKVTTVGGGAFGEQIRGIVSSGPLPEVTLPSSGVGGTFTATAAGVHVPTLLRAGVLSVSTKGGNVGTPQGFSQSSASISNVQIADGIVTADQIISQCRSDADGSSGSVSIVNLRVAGVRARGDAAVALDIPGGRVIVNQQIVTKTHGLTGITVNALHVSLLNSFGLLEQDIILAQSRCEAGGPEVNPGSTTTSTTTSQTTTSSSTSSTSSTSTTSTTLRQGCQSGCTIFGSTVPGIVDAGDAGADVELGVRFFADTDGEVTGVRFYKSPANTGPHQGSLWTRDGELLATATFANETESGWQEVTFAAPVPVTAGRGYVASYHTTAGHYSFDGGYFAAGGVGSEGVDNPPLHAPPDGFDGNNRNGVYMYRPSPSDFPFHGNGGANYWVDVLFRPTL